VLNVRRLGGERELQNWGSNGLNGGSESLGLGSWPKFKDRLRTTAGHDGAQKMTTSKIGKRARSPAYTG